MNINNIRRNTLFKKPVRYIKFYIMIFFIIKNNFFKNPINVF